MTKLKIIAGPFVFDAKLETEAAPKKGAAPKPEAKKAAPAAAGAPASEDAIKASPFV